MLIIKPEINSSHVLREALRRRGWIGWRAARQLRRYQQPKRTQVAVTCQLLDRLRINQLSFTCRSNGLNNMIACTNDITEPQRSFEYWREKDASTRKS